MQLTQEQLVFPVIANRLCFALDARGEFCLDDKNVYGLEAPQGETGWFLLGVLNASPATWWFQRIARPKQGGYFQAEDQFIRKLPIPRVDDGVRSRIAAAARAIHESMAQLEALGEGAGGSEQNAALALQHRAGQQEAEIERLLREHYGFSETEWNRVRSAGPTS